MPFTLAHGAAALPFRRSHLIPSALVIGTFAPDFEYFLRLTPDHGFGHTLVGALVFTLPLSLGVLWLFHRFVKQAAVALFPRGLQERLSGYLGSFDFGGLSQLLMIAASLLVGIATHIVWDSFTHRDRWASEHWAFLRHNVNLPGFRAVPLFKLLQHASTIVGIGILAIWFVGWYRKARLSARNLRNLPPQEEQRTVATVFLCVAFAGAVFRAVFGVGIPQTDAAIAKFAGEMVTTLIALLWWQLLAYGVFLAQKQKPRISQGFPESN